MARKNNNDAITKEAMFRKIMPSAAGRKVKEAQKPVAVEKKDVFDLDDNVFDNFATHNQPTEKPVVQRRVYAAPAAPTAPVPPLANLGEAHSRGGGTAMAKAQPHPSEEAAPLTAPMPLSDQTTDVPTPAVAEPTTAPMPTSAPPSPSGEAPFPGPYGMYPPAYPYPPEAMPYPYPPYPYPPSDGNAAFPPYGYWPPMPPGYGTPWAMTPQPPAVSPQAKTNMSTSIPAPPTSVSPAPTAAPLAGSAPSGPGPATAPVAAPPTPGTAPSAAPVPVAAPPASGTAPSAASTSVAAPPASTPVAPAGSQTPPASGTAPSAAPVPVAAPSASGTAPSAASTSVAAPPASTSVAPAGSQTPPVSTVREAAPEQGHVIQREIPPFPAEAMRFIPPLSEDQYGCVNLVEEVLKRQLPEIFHRLDACACPICQGVATKLVLEHCPPRYVRQEELREEMLADRKLVGNIATCLYQVALDLLLSPPHNNKK